MGHDGGPLDRARSLLLRLIAERQRTGEFRLPRLTELAAQAGVCHVTMQRAVRLLAIQGVLEARPGRGIRLTGFGGGRTESSATKGGVSTTAKKWERVRDALRRDISSGVFLRADRLPPFKVLVDRYGADWRTVRKALGALANEGVLAERPRGFAPTHHVPPTGRNELVLIVRGSGADVIGTWAPRNEEQYRAMEWECAHAGVKLRVVPFWYQNGILVGPGRKRLLELPPEDLDRTLGFMLWTQGLGGLDLQAFLDDLARHGKPIAILDSSGDLASGIRPPAAGYCRLWSVGLSQRCGLVVGRYLLSLGHRRIVYVDDPPGLERLAGLRQAFADCGAADGIEVIGVGDRRDDILTGQCLPDPFVLLRQTVVRSLRVADPAQALLARVIETLAERIAAHYEAAAHWESLDPALERLIVPECPFTALVGGNDAVALHCLKFLGRRGIEVPGTLSVIGFDDTEEALLRNLTSYNFNVPGLMHAMMSFLLYPGILPSRTGPAAPEEVEGFVTVRRTTASIDPAKRLRSNQ